MLLIFLSHFLITRLPHQWNAGSSENLLLTEYSATSAGYDYLTFLSGTQDVDLSFQLHKSLQSTVVLLGKYEMIPLRKIGKLTAFPFLPSTSMME